MGHLFGHQKEGIVFLKKAERAILADEMGLGKTRQAIIAASDVCVPGDIKALVVCPASLKINWQREIQEVYPDDVVRILSTTIPDDTASDVQWLIVNYDILEKKLEYLKALMGHQKLYTLILDEAHYIKGKSIRAAAVVGGSAKKKINGVSGGVRYGDGLAQRMRYVFCLTGTPMLNRPIELFNLLRAINHDLGRNRTTYAKRYCGAYLRTIMRRYAPPIRYMDESGATNLHELRLKLKDVLLRRRKKDVLDLPEKIVTVMECEMSKENSKLYETAWDAYLLFLQENPLPERNIDNIIMARHLVELTKLKQVCSLSKISRMVADIENAVEQDEKVVIFTQYTKTLHELANAAAKIKYDTGKSDAFGKPIMKTISVKTLSGADDMEARQASVDAFQNDEGTKILIANIKAGGVGLNLTAASIVMFADMEWSPEIHRQAEDRAHRIGQEGTVNVYYYICPGTIEEDIVDALNFKKGIMDEVLEGKKNRAKTGSFQDVFLKLLARRTGDK